MAIQLTLETRLKLSIGIIVFAILVVGFLWSVQDAKKNVQQEAEASVSLALSLIDASRHSGVLEPAGVHGWIQQIQGLEKIRHLRITVKALDEAPPPLPALSLSSNDRGVPQWFEWAVMSTPIVASRDLPLDSGERLRFLIESSAEDEIREAWIHTRGFMVLLAMFAISIYVSVHFIAGRALRPVSRILQGLQQMEKGDYDTRLIAPGLPELDRIVEGINHLSATLRDAREENRALTRHSLSIQEDERRTLAKEMHDEVGQSLTAIKMMTAAIPASASHREKAALEIQRLCDRLFSVVRAMIHRLRPMALEDLGLKAALEDLVEHWQLTAPGIRFDVHCDDALQMLRGDTAIEIYRIVQEAVTNTVRHSGASASWIRIQRSDSQHLHLMIMDNGIGMTPHATRRGFGLLGMRERVSSLKGDFDLILEPGQGLQIRIRLPLWDTADA